MKLTNDYSYDNTLDFDEMIREFMATYDNIFFSEIDNEIFIYKPITRKEYKDLTSNIYMSELDINDELCKAALLFPSDFDFDECAAGIPDKLFEDIMLKSCLLNTNDMATLIEINREEADELESQMIMLISESFPNYSYEEIENWDMYKFCKMFSRAEWKMKNLRSLEFNADIVSLLNDMNANNTEEDLSNNNIEIEKEPIPQNNSDNKSNNSNRKMTPEQEAAYKKAMEQFPEIDWSQDTMYTGYDTATASTVAPALREGWYRGAK